MSAYNQTIRQQFEQEAAHILKRSVSQNITYHRLSIDTCMRLWNFLLNAISDFALLD